MACASCWCDPKVKSLIFQPPLMTSASTMLQGAGRDQPDVSTAPWPAAPVENDTQRGCADASQVLITLGLSVWPSPSPIIPQRNPVLYW